MLINAKDPFHRDPRVIEYAFCVGAALNLSITSLEYLGLHRVCERETVHRCFCMHQITTVPKYLRNHPRLLRGGVRRGYYRAHKGEEHELPFLPRLAAKLKLGLV